MKDREWPMKLNYTRVEVTKKEYGKENAQMNLCDHSDWLNTGSVVYSAFSAQHTQHRSPGCEPSSSSSTCSTGTTCQPAASHHCHRYQGKKRLHFECAAVTLDDGPPGENQELQAPNGEQKTLRDALSGYDAQTHVDCEARSSVISCRKLWMVINHPAEATDFTSFRSDGVHRATEESGQPLSSH
ncbi:hypothetical protein EYF80_001827 [Liparis tanakae]|uniref:Uncharacterized protein n=1 Tax=Liparis tanakae TaxID=230148 RepID=A0A4Z2JDM7_9TELE|nr:hypothetical protein EYF80_001827 [Liparis tanakae]